MSEYCDLVIGGTGAIGSCLLKKMNTESPARSLLFTYNRNQEKSLRHSNIETISFALDCNEVNAAALLNSKLLLINRKAENIIFSCFVHDLKSDNYLNVVNSQYTFIEKILLAIDAGDVTYSACRNLVFVVPMNINKDLATNSGYFVLFKMLRQLVLNYIFKFGKKGVLCNFVGVGILDEGFGLRLGEKEKKDYLKHCSLKRFGKVNEVVDPILWLIRKNTLIQGQVLTIDGGL